MTDASLDGDNASQAASELYACPPVHKDPTSPPEQVEVLGMWPGLRSKEKPF